MTIRLMLKKFFNRIKERISKKCEKEKLYQQLSDEKFSQYPYEKRVIEEEMGIVNQVIGQYWKSRYLINHQNKCAYEIMDSNEDLTLFTAEDIAWDTLTRIPDMARERAERLDAHFPISINRFVNGVAQVSWQINPDGRYYRDEDGFGMTDDEEITLYGFIDKNGKVVVKFQTICDYDELDELREMAEWEVNGGKTIKDMFGVKPDVFETNPLDVGIARIQFNLIKRISAIESDAFEKLSEKFESKDPDLDLLSIEVTCFPDVETNVIFLQFFFKAVSGVSVNKSAKLETKEEVLKLVENKDFFFFCKRMVVQLLESATQNEKEK